MATPLLGQLNERVTLQRIERVSDGGGGFDESWVDVAKLWAAIQPATGEERLSAQQRESEIGYHVIIRYRQDLDGSLSLLWRGKRLGVLYASDAGPRAGYITLDCTTAEGL